MPNYKQFFRKFKFWETNPRLGGTNLCVCLFLFLFAAVLNIGFGIRVVRIRKWMKHNLQKENMQLISNMTHSNVHRLDFDEVRWWPHKEKHDTPQKSSALYFQCEQAWLIRTWHIQMFIDWTLIKSDDDLTKRNTIHQKSSALYFQCEQAWLIRASLEPRKCECKFN